MSETVDPLYSTKDTNPKDAIGIRKPPMSTVPWPVLYEVGLAMTEGALKYHRHNYRIAGVRASIYFDAAMRHLASYWEGEDLDPDSGLSHLVKAIASLVVWRDAEMNGKLNDDRPPPARSDWMGDVSRKMDGLLLRYPDGKAPYTKADKAE